MTDVKLQNFDFLWIDNCVNNNTKYRYLVYGNDPVRLHNRNQLLLKNGIEPNPGPRKPRFPCALCSKACKTKCIACDDCDQWVHKDCIGITSAELCALGKSDELWFCPNCNKPNNSSILYDVPDLEVVQPSTGENQNVSRNPSLFDSISDISQSTRATSTSSDCDSSFIQSPTSTGVFHTSSPITKSPTKSQNRKAKGNHLRILTINFQSLRRKGKELEALIEETEPDIILGNETWLDPDILSPEILPTSLGYCMLQRDRPGDHHGGVVIIHRNDLHPSNVQSSKYLELISASFTFEKKKVFVASFYRPPTMTDVSYLDTVSSEFNTLKHEAKKTL